MDYLRLALAVLLVCACVLVPAALTTCGLSWLGLVTSIAAMILWMRLVRASPGFFQGILCLSGLAAIFGVFVTALIVNVRSLFI